MTVDRIRKTSVLQTINIPLASGAIVYRGNEVGVVSGTFTCNNLAAGTAAAPMVPIGMPLEDADQSLDYDVPIELKEPVELEWFDNGNSLTQASNFLTKVYFSDSHTVTSVNHSGISYYPLAGIVWQVDSIKGVGVQRSVRPGTESLLS
jgi:hypothetical protein